MGETTKHYEATEGTMQTDADTEAGRGEGRKLAKALDLLAIHAEGAMKLDGEDSAQIGVDRHDAETLRKAADRLRQSGPDGEPHLKSVKVHEMVCTAFDDGATFGSDPRVTKDDVREESERYATDYVEKVYGRLLTTAPTDEAPEGEADEALASLDRWSRQPEAAEPSDVYWAVQEIRKVIDRRQPEPTRDGGGDDG